MKLADAKLAPSRDDVHPGVGAFMVVVRFRLRTLKSRSVKHETHTLTDRRRRPRAAYGEYTKGGGPKFGRNGEPAMAAACHAYRSR